MNPDKPFERFRKDYEGRFYSAYAGMDKPFRFIDARTALDGGADDESRYIDYGHYNDRGAQVLAYFIFENIREDIGEILAARRAMAVVIDKPAPGSGALILDEDALAGRTEAE